MVYPRFIITHVLVNKNIVVVYPRFVITRVVINKNIVVFYPRCVINYVSNGRTMLQKRSKTDATNGSFIETCNNYYGVGRTIVDLQMAQTYIPAFFCIMKSSVLIFLLCSTYVSNHILIQLSLIIFLYIDRVVRNEAIFDSNAILCNILTFYIINNFRSVENTKPHRYLSVSAVPVICHILQGIYCSSAVLLFFGCETYPCIIRKTHSHTAKPYIIIMHGVLLVCIVQLPEHGIAFNQHFTITRSYAFLLLSIAWSYINGIPYMVKLLQGTPRSPYAVNDGEKDGRYNTTVSTVVQSFVHCQLMFTAILFVTDAYFYILVVIFAVIMCHRFSMLGKNECISHVDYFTTIKETGACPSQLSGIDDITCMVNTGDINSNIPVLFANTSNATKGGHMFMKTLPIYTPEDDKESALLDTNLQNVYKNPTTTIPNATSAVLDDTMELFRRAQQNANNR
jgi:hypothetical protein